MSHFEVTEQNFETEVLASSLPVLVDFTAEWCPPCKMIAPIVSEIGRKYEGKLRVGLLDTDVHQEIVQQYGVMGMPTLILFVNGAPATRIVGYQPLDRIEGKILPHLEKAF